MLRNPSKYQLAIGEAFQQQDSHILMNAVPGSGKTTTIEWLTRQFCGGLSVLYLVFNKSNQQEAQKRLKDLNNVKAQTFNSFGNGLLFNHNRRKKRWQKLEVDKVDKIWKFTVNDFTAWKEDSEEKSRIFGWSGSVCKLVSLLRGHAIFSKQEAADSLDELIEFYGVDIPSKRESFIQGVLDTFVACIEQTAMIDFDDQLYLPLLLDLPFPKYDIVLVDEAQDMNPVKHETVKRLTDNGALAVVVGDSWQAIYGFAGAHTASMEHVAGILSNGRPVKQLPLSVNYRCDHAIIAEAQEINPLIEPHDEAGEGLVESTTMAEYSDIIQDGDMAICRETAPLVGEALKRYREGRNAYVLGRDLGQAIIDLVKICIGNGKENEEMPVELAMDAIETYRAKRLESLRKRHKDMEAESLNDRVDTALIIFEECDTVGDAYNRIHQIFSDQSSGIMYATIHKVKGLENNRVFILRPDRLPHPSAKKDWEIEQERNLRFVAITRAKHELYYVYPSAGD